jgi:hypothetical protein
METDPGTKADYSGSAFLLALAAALQSGGFAVTLLPYVWAAAAAALFYKFLISSPLVRRCLPFFAHGWAALAVSFIAFIGILTANYMVPSMSLQIADTEPYVIQDQTVGLKWVKIEATRRGAGNGICYAYIDELSKDGQKGFILEPGEHRRLTADDGGDPGLDNGFHIGGGMSRMFNIATVRPGGKTMHVESKAFNALISEPLGKGVYRAKIEVSGADCGPVYANLMIKYGDGSDISVSMARTSWWSSWF